MSSKNTYTSPKRQKVKSKRIVIESTAKKNHSSSSQVNNFSREENKDISEPPAPRLQSNIHMRETFKCGEDLHPPHNRLGFSFLDNKKRVEKESLALWKNVSMPLSSPSKVASRSSHKENRTRMGMVRLNRRTQNPFDESRDSYGQINSSKTRMIQLNREGSNLKSRETNISSLANNGHRSANGHSPNLRPIWQNSPLTSFNQIQSFQSGNKESSQFDHENSTNRFRVNHQERTRENNV